MNLGDVIKTSRENCSRLKSIVSDQCKDAEVRVVCYSLLWQIEQSYEAMVSCEEYIRPYFSATELFLKPSRCKKIYLGLNKLPAVSEPLVHDGLVRENYLRKHPELLPHDDHYILWAQALFWKQALSDQCDNVCSAVLHLSEKRFARKETEALVSLYTTLSDLHLSSYITIGDYLPR